MAKVRCSHWQCGLLCLLHLRGAVVFCLPLRHGVSLISVSRRRGVLVWVVFLWYFLPWYLGPRSLRQHGRLAALLGLGHGPYQKQCGGLFREHCQYGLLGVLGLVCLLYGGWHLHGHVLDLDSIFFTGVIPFSLFLWEMFNQLALLAVWKFAKPAECGMSAILKLEALEIAGFWRHILQTC